MAYNLTSFLDEIKRPRPSYAKGYAVARARNDDRRRAQTSQNDIIRARGVNGIGQKHSFNYTLSSSTNEFFSSFPQQRTQSKKRSWDDVQSYAKHCISLIEDPLWKHVCTELINMMGPESVLKIWNSDLGFFSSGTKTIGISCQAKEAAQLIQQYDFVLLGVLRRYFPTLNKLRVVIASNSYSCSYTCSSFCS